MLSIVPNLILSYVFIKQLLTPILSSKVLNVTYFECEKEADVDVRALRDDIVMFFPATKQIELMHNMEIINLMKVCCCLRFPSLILLCV